MKSDKDKLYIKIVELNEIYNFVVRFLFEIIYSAKKILLNLKFPDFEIQNLEFSNNLRCGLYKVVV